MNTGILARNLVAVLLVLAAASCTMLRPKDRNLSDIGLPSSFTLYAPAAPAPDRWWEAFESEELNRLVDGAVGGNLTLQQAVARIRQAAAAAERAGALRWPEVSYGADGSVSRRHTDTGESQPVLSTAAQKLSALNTLLNNNPFAAGAQGSGSATPALTGPFPLANAGLQAVQSNLATAQSNLGMARTNLNALDSLLSGPPSSEMTFSTESYGLALTTAYEVDIWGRLRASHRSAQLTFEASREDLYAVMHTLAGQVALTWLDLLQVDQILDLLDEQLEANRTTLELVELRFGNGMATALDVYQQRQAVAQVVSQMPPLESQRETLLHELAILLGNYPRTDLGLTPGPYPDLGPLPEQGIPAGLLAKRPDVRAAGLRLRSADWQVSAARAERLPTIRLTGSASYGADQWHLIFDNWVASLAASVTGPVFDAGERKAEVERTRAVVDERVAVYKETVIWAVQEVEDALVRESKQREYIQALEKQLEYARATHREALSRYRKRLNDYLAVLSALTSVQALERILLQAQHDLIVHRVQLHLALGGSWMPEAAEDLFDDPISSVPQDKPAADPALISAKDEK